MEITEVTLIALIPAAVAIWTLYKESKDRKEKEEKAAEIAERKTEREADRAEREAEKKRSNKMSILRIASERAYKNFDMTAKKLGRAHADHDIKMQIHGKNDFEAFQEAYAENETAYKNYTDTSDQYIDYMMRLAEGEDVSDEEIREVLSNEKTK